MKYADSELIDVPNQYDNRYLLDDDFDDIELLKSLENESLKQIEEDWARGNLRYKLHAAQRKIYDTVRELPVEVRDVILFCSRRFGKSVLGILMALEDCINNPNVYVYVVGPELAQTMEIVAEKLDLICADMPKGMVVSIRGGRRYRVGQSTLVVGAYDKDNVGKAKGKEAFAIYTEEACDSDSKQFEYGMKEVYSPLLLHSKGRFVHMTTPPRELNHIFLTEYVPKSVLANTFFKYTIHDNPLIDAEMFAQAVHDSGGSVKSISFRRNYLCEVVRDGSLVVLPSFDDTLHVEEFEVPQFGNWIVFGDTGGVKDKTWFGIGWYDFATATFMILDERVFEANTATSVIVTAFAELESWLPGGYFGTRYIDMSGQLQVDFQKDHQISTCLPGKDNFDAAINQLEMAFLQNKIKIHKRCKFLLTSCAYGTFNKARTTFARNGALGHCDALAGLMYGWRMVDKITNPVPFAPVIRDTHFQATKYQDQSLGMSSIVKLYKRF